MAENERDIVKELLARFGIGDEGNPGSSPEPDPVARVGSLVIPERPETLPPVSLERRVPAARPERPAPSEKRPTPPEEVVEQVKEKLSEIREILDSLKEVVSMMKEIQEERMHVVLDPFKVAEFMGTGHGSFVWARLLLPKTGDTVEATILVPDNEVWWLTFGIFGDAPSSSFTIKYRALNTRMVTKYEYAIDIPEVLYHEGWIGEPLCAEGWTRFDTSLTVWLRNVTGNSNYTDLPNQDIIVKYTAFLYVIEKRFADEMEVHIDSFFRRWAQVTRPLARRFMIPGKDISVTEYERGE